MFKEIKHLLDPKKPLIIRSSIYPGICLEVQKFLGKKFQNISYCPERVVQGKSIEELPKLPQIISGVSKKAINSSEKIFKEASVLLKDEDKYNLMSRQINPFGDGKASLRILKTCKQFLNLS